MLIIIAKHFYLVIWPDWFLPFGKVLRQKAGIYLGRLQDMVELRWSENLSLSAIVLALFLLVKCELLGDCHLAVHHRSLGATSIAARWRMTTNDVDK